MTTFRIPLAQLMVTDILVTTTVWSSVSALSCHVLAENNTQPISLSALSQYVTQDR